MSPCPTQAVASEVKIQWWRKRGWWAHKTTSRCVQSDAGVLAERICVSARGIRATAGRL